MGMQSVLSIFGRGLSEASVRSNWPDTYSDAIVTVHGTETDPGSGIYVHVESTYDREHEAFLPALLQSIPGATLVVLTQMNDTTDSGAAWGYRNQGEGVEYLGRVRGEERGFGRDVVDHYETAYGVRIWTLWEVFDYGFARDSEE